MALTLSNIKKWTKMVFGKSEAHVKQNLGRSFDKANLNGYFNDLTNKVLIQKQFVDNNEIPYSIVGKERCFVPMEIFQYALGCYDLYLLNKNDNRFFEEFIKCSEWAVESQNGDGSWNNFYYIYPKYPFSSMCQGEGASLLLRAYKETNKMIFIECAKKAIDFMLTDVRKGGTACYINNGLVLKEFVNQPTVLNGWIFSLFGLYDFLFFTKEKKYKNAFELTLSTLKSQLSNFDANYWSYYDLGGRIASPFYHNLHIAQLEALMIVDSDGAVFNEFQIRLKKYKKNKFYAMRAFFKKIKQKIKEKEQE